MIPLISKDKILTALLEFHMLCEQFKLTSEERRILVKLFIELDANVVNVVNTGTFKHE